MYNIQIIIDKTVVLMLADHVAMGMMPGRSILVYTRLLRIAYSSQRELETGFYQQGALKKPTKALLIRSDKGDLENHLPLDEKASGTSPQDATLDSF